MAEEDICLRGLVRGAVEARGAAAACWGCAAQAEGSVWRDAEGDDGVYGGGVGEEVEGAGVWAGAGGAVGGGGAVGVGCAGGV